MAKEFKNQKGVFEFIGILKEIKQIKKDENDTNISRIELVVHDKDMESDVKLSLFPSSVAKYWDSNSKKIVEVNNRVEETMREVKANNMGMPFGIEMKTPKSSKMYYINDELISDLCKLQPNKFTVKIIGNIDFRLYNNRVQKNYSSIKSIEILTGKQQHGLFVNFPVVISEMNKSKFVYGETINRVNGLVKTKLENGQYAYRPIELGLDKNYFMKGYPVEVAKSNKVDLITLINNQLMKLVRDGMNAHNGYVCLSIIGRLKVGEIVKKPTIDDLNPMEKVLLEIQGEEAIKTKLESMDLIKEYFDSVIVDSFNFEQGEVAQEISESELNLDTNGGNSISQPSNPMLDILQGMTADKKSVEKVDSIFGDNEEEKEETKSSTTEKLEQFVNETNVKEEVSTETNSYSDDDFPF